MKDGFVKIAAAAPEIRVADCEYNADVIITEMGAAAKLGIKLLCFPEMCVTGYTIGDLLFQQTLIAESERQLFRIAEATKGLDMLVFVGLPFSRSGKIYNCAAALFDGRIIGMIPKSHLPTYSEFYELRNFELPPEGNMVASIGDCEFPFGTRLLFVAEKMPLFTVAAEICEDIWVANSPSIAHTSAGASVIVNLSASNEFVEKGEYRHALVGVQSAKCSCAYLYCSAGEGESTTDVVFSGHRIISELGIELVSTEPFERARFTVADVDVFKIDQCRSRAASVSTPSDEGYWEINFDLAVTDTELSMPVEPLVFVPSDPVRLDKRCADILKIQTAALAKRMTHINCKKLLLGVSGGLDSTLALVVCCRTLDLLGRPHSDVVAVTMPCFGTTKRTRGNAEKLCEALGVEFKTIDISDTVASHLRDIGVKEGDYSTAYENAQARERTQVLMDMANDRGGIVVGTGDLSEGALGFSTYNGDHMSMYSVNCSVPKTVIGPVLRYAARQSGYEGIAATVDDVIDTPVSPELLPTQNGKQEQATQAVVGPYELVDFFLYYSVRWGFSPLKIVRIAKHAFGEKYTEKEIGGWLKVFYRRFFNNQFKRSCVPDGPKIGSVALSPRGDWRMPSDACATLWLKQLENF